MKYHDAQQDFKDPVCDMVVSRLTAISTTEYGDKTYYFCSGMCRERFEKTPEKYVGKWPCAQ